MSFTRTRRVPRATAVAMLLALSASSLGFAPAADAEGALDGVADLADVDMSELAQLPASDSAVDPWAESFAEDESTISMESSSATTSDATTSSSGPVKLPSTPAPIRTTGGGWGHGIGMSQYGARAMAESGRSHTQILTHYHTGTAVQTRATPSSFRVGLLAKPWGVGATANQEAVHFDRTTLTAVGGDITWRVCQTATGSCSSVVRTQPAGTRYVAGSTPDGRMILRHDNGTVYVDDDTAQFLRADLTGTSTTRMRVAEKGDREYRWGSLEIRRPLTGHAGKVRATINFGNRFEQYLYGLAEVPFSWHGEALRAQVVAARSYALGRNLAPRTICNCVLTDGTENQVYYGAGQEMGAFGANWRAAVDGTAGRVLTYDGTVIPTFYSSSHNRRSENIEDVWTNPQPYHRSVDDPWSGHARAGNPNASWTANIGNASLASRAGGGMQVATYVRVVERTQGGTPRTIEVHGRDSSGGTVVRQLSGTGAASQKTIGNILRSAHGLRSAQIDVMTPSPFADTQTHVLRSHVYDIAQLARMGLTNGCGDPEIYCPTRSVQRGEMAAFLHRALGEPPPPQRHPFPDVSRSAYYDRAVSYIYAEGITTGWGETGEYRPRESVTRAQMVAFLWRMAGEPTPPKRHSYPDVLRSAYYDQAVSWAVDRGITTGWGNTGRFEPHRDVSRAQMASFLVRYVGSEH